MRRATMGLGAVLLVVALAGTLARAEPARVIGVEAKRFQFTPAELTVKVGQPVTLRLTSVDVTHGFYQKELGIDAEIAPGRTTEVTFTPARTGRFLIICDHFCGSGHGNMKMTFVVE